MSSNLIPNFIIIDDDFVNNLVCRRIIEIVYPDADIKTFTDPEEGLSHLKSDYVQQNASNTILFLDINMPTLSGWEFLNSFEQFDSSIKEQLKIYMLSSSVNPQDKVRAGSNKNVWDYIEKPLTRQAVESTVAKIREEERAAISREIHDELGQKLMRLKMDIIWLGTRIKDPNEEILAKIAGATALVDETVQTIRRINTELRPRIIDDLGLFATIESQADEFSKHSGIPCTLTINMEEQEFSKLLSVNIFRIYQETLTNIGRHSKANRVSTEINYEDGKLVMQIEDDGIGADLEKPGTKKSFGLVGMKERAAMINGDINISSSPGEGMKVKLSVPVII